LCRKLKAYRHTFDSVLGTNQYWAISVKFLAQGNNDWPLTGFGPLLLAIIRLLVQRINHSVMIFVNSCLNIFLKYYDNHNKWNNNKKWCNLLELVKPSLFTFIEFPWIILLPNTIMYSCEFDDSPIGFYFICLLG
jgi:hypothetical protein